MKVKTQESSTTPRIRTVCTDSGVVGEGVSWEIDIRC